MKLSLKAIKMKTASFAISFGKCFLRNFVVNLDYKNLRLNLFILKGFVIVIVSEEFSYVIYTQPMIK